MLPLAYLDPGSGTMLVQLIAGGVAGVAVAGKMYWRRLKRTLGFGRSDEEQPD